MGFFPEMISWTSVRQDLATPYDHIKVFDCTRCCFKIEVLIKLEFLECHCNCFNVGSCNIENDRMEGRNFD